MSPHKLALELLKANSDPEIVAILEKAGFWDNPDTWRDLGDNESNVATVNNQQADPVAAATEKLTNSTDACLIDACRLTGHEPDDPNGPQNPHDAVTAFMPAEGTESNNDAEETDIVEYDDPDHEPKPKDRTNGAYQITAAVSNGVEDRGTLTISDNGEGQAPDAFPDTMCSLSKSNKNKIPFSQGQFNMGSTGVLKFCGEHHLQFVLSRRNPAYAGNGEHQWGFTVVRRRPAGPNEKNPVYEYLAPVGRSKKPRRGKVMRFSADTMPIFPQVLDTKPVECAPYGTDSTHGTLVKMYDIFDKSNMGTNVWNKNASSLLRQFELCQSDFPIPVELYECRHPVSPGNKFYPENHDTLYGIVRRMQNPRISSLEHTASASIKVGGADATVNIFLYRLATNSKTNKKKPKAAWHRNRQNGVVFCVNGQKHGTLPTDWFGYKAGMQPLQNSLFVQVDCSGLGSTTRTDLFMSSRDRLSEHPLRFEMEKMLAEVIKSNPDLKFYAEKRSASNQAVDPSEITAELVQDILSGNQDWEDIFAGVVGNLFQAKSSTGNKGSSSQSQPKQWKGQFSPTIFDPVKTTAKVAIGKTVRMQFTTDVADDYFHRGNYKGSYQLFLRASNGYLPIQGSAIPLHSGRAYLSFPHPSAAQVGDTYEYVLEVTGPTQDKALRSHFKVNIVEKNPAKPKKPKRKISLPKVIPVSEDNWGDGSQHDELTAIVLERKTGTDPADNSIKNFNWSWNADHKFLVNPRNKLMSRVSAADREAKTKEFNEIVQGVSFVQAICAMKYRELLVENAENEDVPSIEELVRMHTGMGIPFALRVSVDMRNAAQAAKAD